MDPAERINGISPRLPNPINNSPIIRSRVADPQRMKVDLNPILFDDDGNHDREWKRVRKRRTASSLETQLDHRFDPPGFRDAFNFRKTSLLSLNHRSHDSCAPNEKPTTETQQIWIGSLSMNMATALESQANVAVNAGIRCFIATTDPVSGVSSPRIRTVGETEYFTIIRESC